ncbi:hypothetical protein [Lysobacter sp. Root983]|uniref:hypothetical protein n=1 Tax=Lysobacter sp. Root983 TaxID=1736613 RepID=UPI00070AB994|nr:hypothetical protein [Lysobacter sp. Root983]KRD74849.1 hypothetical protein ASE43_16705 [Lysobacter sp. Root983]
MGPGGDRRRGRRITAFAAAPLAFAFAASAAPAPPPAAPVPAETADETLYMSLADLTGELYKCVGPYMQEVGGPKVAAKVYAAGRYPALVVSASSVLGSGHLTVLSARDNPAGSVGQTQSLIVAMGMLGSSDANSIRQNLLSAKAVAIVATEIAGVSEGRCKVSPELTAAIARVPPEP